MNNENGVPERSTAAHRADSCRADSRPVDAEHLALVERRMDELAAHGVVGPGWRDEQAELWNMIRDGTVHSLDGHSATAGSPEDPCAAADTPVGDPPGRGP